MTIAELRQQHKNVKNSVSSIFSEIIKQITTKEVNLKLKEDILDTYQKSFINTGKVTITATSIAPYVDEKVLSAIIADMPLFEHLIKRHRYITQSPLKANTLLFTMNHYEEFLVPLFEQEKCTCSLHTNGKGTYESMTICM